MTLSNESLVHLFGYTSLMSPSTSKLSKPSRVIGNKVVLLYFSAYWCAPCQHFTPRLIRMYRFLKKRNVDLEVVYSTMDKNEQQYQAYSEKMPWWCIPFGSPLNEVLARRFDAQGIPHLVVLDRDGSVITDDGVGMLSLDPKGQQFPWRPEPLRSILPDCYLKGNQARPVSELNDKYIMLYFSAHWCPPCRQFTPKLARTYKQLQEIRQDFEIVFVSADKTKREFEAYFGEMPFAALPYEACEARGELAKRLKIRGYPTLLVLGPQPADSEQERELINPNMRAVVENEQDLHDFPYYPKPYGNITSVPEDINDHKCIMVFHEHGDDEQQSKTMQALKEASQRLQDIKCYWALDESHVSSSIRRAVGLSAEQKKPTMILLDIPDNGGFYLEEDNATMDEITTERVLAFARSPGARQQIQ